MNAIRASALLPADSHVAATSEPNRFGGAWVLTASYLVWDPTSGFKIERRVVTQFAPNDGAFYAARWINEFDALRSSR